MNKPPAAASKMLTLMTSPMPNLISGGGRWSPKIPVRVGGQTRQDLDDMGRQRHQSIGRPCQSFAPSHNGIVRMPAVAYRSRRSPPPSDSDCQNGAATTQPPRRRLTLSWALFQVHCTGCDRIETLMDVAKCHMPQRCRFLGLTSTCPGACSAQPVEPGPYDYSSANCVATQDQNKSRAAGASGRSKIPMAGLTLSPSVTLPT